MPIRAMADLIIDTSNLTVHELRDIFMQMSRDEQHARRDGGEPGELRLQAWRAAWMPTWCSTCAACRTRTSSISLRRLTGRDAAVVRYMRQARGDAGFHRPADGVPEFALPQYVREGKSYLTVAIGCTGGQHRSVMIAEALKKSLARSVQTA